MRILKNLVNVNRSVNGANIPQELFGIAVDAERFEGAEECFKYPVPPTAHTSPWVAVTTTASVEITTSLLPVPQPEEMLKVIHVLRPAIRTITQSSACRQRALLPTYGLCFVEHAAQRFCLPVESVGEVPRAAEDGILQVVDSVRKIVSK